MFLVRRRADTRRPSPLAGIGACRCSARRKSTGLPEHTRRSSWRVGSLNGPEEWQRHPAVWKDDDGGSLMPTERSLTNAPGETVPERSGPALRAVAESTRRRP